jgi:[histone H3]-lysine36 N-trimethyltransferase
VPQSFYYLSSDIEGRNEAQPCYCGEDKCVGFIGGKTQTDIAGMDDLYLDGAYFHIIPQSLTNTRCFAALGISEEVDRLGLKGSKKKKSKKLDEDWMVSAPADSAFHGQALTRASLSQYSSPWLLRMYQRLSRLCDKPKAARFLSSYSLE